jgi:hypothetical protein
MGIEGITLKHHGNVSVFRSHIIDQLAVYINFSAGDIFKTGDHFQGSGFTAPRWAQKHHKFFILNLQVEFLDNGNSFDVFFINIF